MAVAKRLGGDELIRRNNSLLTTEVDGELMAMSIDLGLCFGLDRIGTRIWALIAEPISLDALCAQLGSEYDVEASTCRSDVARLVERLRAEGLASVKSR